MKLLNSRFRFYGADILLSMLIWNYLFLEAAGMLRWLPGQEVPLTYMINLLRIVFGVLSIVLGVKLLKLKYDLYGLAKPFSYGLIVTGVAHATVILLPVAMYAGIFVDILLANIFFRAAKNPISNKKGQSPYKL